MRWLANLAIHWGLGPRYTEIDKSTRAGGVGGSGREELFLELRRGFCGRLLDLEEFLEARVVPEVVA